MLIKCFSVKIMLFELYFLIWSQTAETLTDRLTDLGQNVTINCDLHEEEVYWLLIKPDSPVVIFRTMLSGPFYGKNGERFKRKYSVQSKHDLFIYNVTHDELGFYYCMSPDKASRTFSNGTRLHIADSTPESHNDTEVKSNDCNDTTQWPVIMLGLMNGVLLIVVIGLLKGLACESRRTRQNSQQPQDSDQSQYAEVNCSTSQNPIPLNSTYALVQLPKSKT